MRYTTIAGTEAVYAGPCPATGRHFSHITTGANLISGLYRIQSASYAIEFPRKPINQYGEHGAIDMPTDKPIVNFALSYLLASFWNERMFGLVIDNSVSCIANLVNKTQDEKNYFVKTVSQGQDAICNEETDVFIAGIGNAYLNRYESSASVGNFPIVNVNFEATNISYIYGLSGQSPAINPVNGKPITGYPYVIPVFCSSPGTGDLDISSLRPGDISFSAKQRMAEDEGILTNATGNYTLPGFNLQDATIQGYSLSLDIPREAIGSLGSRYAFAREIQLPVTVNLEIDALASELNTGNFADLVNCDSAFDITIKLNRPDNCDSDLVKTTVAQYTMRNAKFNGQSSNSIIGANKTVKLNFFCHAGTASHQTMGLFLSGVGNQGPHALPGQYFLWNSPTQFNFTDGILVGQANR
jgi:hypothetical protein